MSLLVVLLAPVSLRTHCHFALPARFLLLSLNSELLVDRVLDFLLELFGLLVFAGTLRTTWLDRYLMR